jgi:hypothetical protein
VVQIHHEFLIRIRYFPHNRDHNGEPQTQGYKCEQKRHWKTSVAQFTSVNVTAVLKALATEAGSADHVCSIDEFAGLLERPKAVHTKGGQTRGVEWDRNSGISDRMKTSMNSTLAATLIATFVGVGAWFFGLAGAIWPAHPQLAAFVMTVVVSVLVKQIWPVALGSKRI